MSPEAQRIAIAEACGWLFDHIRADAMYWIPEKNYYVGSPLYDLNAMHEATVAVIHEDPHLRRRYYQTLDQITGDQWNTIDATAALRAEAFLRTLNLWQD